MGAGALALRALVASLRPRAAAVSASRLPKHHHKNSDLDLVKLEKLEAQAPPEGPSPTKGGRWGRWGRRGSGLWEPRGPRRRGPWGVGAALAKSPPGLPGVLLAAGLLFAAALHLFTLRRVQRYPLRLAPCQRSLGGAGGPSREWASRLRGTGAGGLAETQHPELDGIAFICTGIREGHGCDLPLMCNSLSLLRFTGGWSGRVWVITDVESELRAICPTAPFEAVQAPAVSSVMEMKNFKRQLFEIIPGSPKALLYMDSDILSVGCLDPFLAHVGAADMAMFHDVFCPLGGCNEFCGGFIYMRDTPGTRQCIADWDAELRRDGYRFYRKDQDALDVVRRRGGCLGVRPYPYSMMQAVDAGFFYQMFDQYRLKRPIFQHFTHGIRRHRVWPSVYGAIEAQMKGYMPQSWSPPTVLRHMQGQQSEHGSPGGGDLGQGRGAGSAP